MINIEFPDGSKKEFDSGITGLEVAQSIGERLAKDALAIKINDTTTDLTTPITEDSKVSILTFNDEEGKQVFWHSSAHILAMAVKSLYPDAKLTMGPAIDNGFYYDFASEPFRPEDLEKIEAKIKEIIEADIPFVKVSVSKSEAEDMFKDNKYKLELIQEYKDNLTIYTNDNFRDLCRGPHVPSTKYIKSIKLTKTSAAYWKGNAENDSLQRIYGIAFPDKKLLKQHLNLLEEAEKRNHIKIGKHLDLYSFHEEGPGFPFFHPKGMVIKNTLVDYWRKEHTKAGYVEIQTPIMLKQFLWEQSGHWNNYKENMYISKVDNEDYAIKPMNCPGGMLIYKTKIRSYRDLPMRVGELGTVHRHEKSGVLNGLFRVRVFTQDDAHIYSTPEEVEQEIINIINLEDKFYKLFGFEYSVDLSTRPSKSIGTDEQWKIAEDALKKALEKVKIDYTLNPGDGAFYGPKIDFHLKDAIGRTWQCGTIQFDMAQPENFDLSYEGKDGKKHRPIMLHRTVYGSLERFMGILVEHYSGKFPLWLNPNQVVILPVADRFQEYADKVAQSFREVGIRADVDGRTESISRKVRDAELQHYNYILVVGEKEIKDKTVTVRTRDNQVEGAVKSEEFAKRVVKEMKAKKL